MLLQLMLNEKFDAFITADKNLMHQQNLSRYSIPVLVLQTESIDYASLAKLVPRILKTLASPLLQGPVLVSV